MMTYSLVREWLSQALGGMTIRTALLAGFALVFTLWLASAFHVTQRLEEFQARADALYLEFARSEELLFTVRAQVLLAAIHVRDYLLEPSEGGAGQARAHLEKSRAETQHALDQYLPEVDSPAKRESWAELEGELRDYWAGLIPVLSRNAADRAEGHRTLLAHGVAQREVISRISDRIRTLNQDAFREQQLEVDALQRALVRRIWATSGLAVALGLGVAMIATRYAGILETRIRHQHEVVVRNREELVRLSAQLVRAQEDERRRIARELHDEVGQALTAIKVELALVERSLGGATHEIRALGDARKMTEGVLQTIRDLCQLLRPPTLDDFGLPEAVTAYLRGFSQRTGIRTSLVQESMEARVSPEVEVCVYRVVQEALTNVARHAQATSCRVFLQRLGTSLVVTIEDDGKGVDLGQAATQHVQRGLGLVGVRERATDLGGTYRFESAPGKGARLTVELPAEPSSHHTALREVAS